MNRRDKDNYYLDIAETVSERGTCIRRNYGSIIVKNDEIISTGYTGAPRGRQNCIDRKVCIREELKVGHMETVNVLLNRPFNVTGVVSIGNQLGRKLDFPTINIYPTEYKLLPPNGVYATQTTIDGEKFYGVTNLGTKPTVSDAPEISVETFLFDFDQDVYGKKVDVEFIHFIRPEMKFEDVEGLKRQIAADSDFARNMFLIG